MEKTMEFAIGFVAGRTNVCNVINAYYDDILEQASRFDKKVNVTIYILIDLTYLGNELESFYNLSKDVLDSNINIVYITPDDLIKEKELLIKKHKMETEELEAILGYGHAKCRNTLLYYAIKEKRDALLFWDDDEYPVANVLKENGDIEWIKQDNILVHLKNIEKADATIGYHCGYISPIPYIDYKNEIAEEDLQDFIEAVSNEIINWSVIKEKFEKTNGVTYADEKFVRGQGEYPLEQQNGAKWVAGSTLCINLKKKENIASFFNPKGARGEDTFFSIRMKDAEVIRVPLYHFHDGFLKYTQIMNKEFPTKLRKISGGEVNCGRRFLKASIGWIKYKPLYSYIINKETYQEDMKTVAKKLDSSIPSINKVFKSKNFVLVKEAFDEVSSSIQTDYDQYIKNDEIWKKLKNNITKG